MWAFVSTLEWLDYVLETNPNFPILCALGPSLESIRDKWISIIKLKNHIEVFAMMISCFGWVFSLNAPLLAVAYS